ncbi:MAG: low-specificity L-threonine aldolase [bacterium]
MNYIDLRSDTVTKPSPEMRQAIANAEVGDDVLGDDPTVQRLEAMVAELFGREASLFVPSGSMGNQISLYTISHHGDEIICDEGCHIFNYEVATAAAFSGLLFHVIKGRHGVYTADDVAPLIRGEDLHSPRTRIIEVENTHNRAGGTVFPLENIKALRALADERGLLMHLDGARIWNAHTATGVPLAEYAKYFDSISVCLSKGLGAPVGSMVIGDREFITAARRTRKMFGGGMRQVGLLAAAGIYALEHNLGRLQEDHDNARVLAENLAKLPGIEIDLDTVQTNIVIFEVAESGMNAVEALGKLKEQGVLAVPFGPTRIRCVTHLDVNSEQIETALKAFQKVFV